MRYFGGGIGHQSQEDRWTTSGHNKELDGDAMDVDGSEDIQVQDETSMNNPILQLQELHQLASHLTSQAAGESDEDFDPDESDSDVDSVGDADEDLFADNDSDEVDLGPEDGDGEGNSDNGFDGF